MMFGLRAKNPMMPRLADLDRNVPVSFLIGERSFLPYGYLLSINQQYPDLDIRVHVSSFFILQTDQ